MDKPEGLQTGFTVNMMLSNYAAVAGGLLHISGGGWTQIDTPCPQTAIALILGIPWSESNRRIPFSFVLVDQDGHPQQQVGDDPSTTIRIDGEFEVGRPPGHLPGSHIEWSVALLIPPLNLPPQSRMAWILTVDGQSHEDWNLAFSTR